MDLDKTHLAVIGAGTMGTGIAITALRAGCPTTLVEAEDGRLAAGVQLIERFLAASVERGKLTASEQDAALALLEPATDLTAVAESDAVIEAIYEDLEAKQRLLGSLDEICPPETFVVTNTSTLSVTRIAAGSARPGQVVGMHFCNPAPLMPLVEVVRGIETSDAAFGFADQLARGLGKTPVTVTDTPGFIVNRFLLPFENDCIRALEAGLASVEDIDTAVKLGLGHPMGPFTLLDVVGLDTHRSVSLSIYDQVHDPRFAPPPLVDRMIAAGRLGRKSGRGFYDYESAGMFGT